MSTARDALRDLLDAPEAEVLVLTGAGVSVASGIPTFRGSDPGAVWANDVTELGSHRFFLRDPVTQWRWYLSRFQGTHAAQPNAAHHALVALETRTAERGQGFLLVTQNIDGLHRLAGSSELIEVHGTARRVRCDTDGCTLGAPMGSLPFPAAAFAAFAEDPGTHTLPRCPVCDGLLRAHVLWFDETYDSHADYGIVGALEGFRRMSVLVCVGTSFQVGITEMALRTAHRFGVPVFSIDPHASAGVPSFVRTIREPAEVLLPELVAP